MESKKQRSEAEGKRTYENHAVATPDQDTVILSVRLVSGHFESTIHIPVSATKEERDAFVLAWLGLMDAGVKVGQASRAKT